MSAETIGVAKSKIGNSYEVKYDKASGFVYVSYSCWTEIGKVTSVADAMQKAEEFLFDK